MSGLKAIVPCKQSQLVVFHVTVAMNQPPAETQLDALREPPNRTQKALLARITKRQAAGDDSGIDYSDIPSGAVLFSCYGR